MSSAAGYLIDFFNVFVEVWTSREIFKTFGPRKSDKKWSYILEGGMTLLTVSAIVWNRSMVRYSTALIIIVYLWTSLMFRIFYFIPVKKILAWNGCWWMIMGWMELIGLMLSSMILKEEMIILNRDKPISNYVYIFCMTCAIGMFAIFYLLNNVNVLQKVISKFENFFCIVSIISFGVLLPYFMSLGYEIINKIYLICTALALLSMFLLCIVFCILTVQKDAEEKYIRMVLYMKTGAEQLEKYELKTSELLKKEHDFKHHLNYLRQCLDEGQLDNARQYIDNMFEAQAERKKMYTGQHTIDIILEDKIRLAREKEIQAKANINILICPVDAVDICIILGNILDNAIEAAEKCMSGKRWIQIDIYSIKELFFIEVDNSCAVLAKKSGEVFLTSKSDSKKHGLGLKSVKDIVEKNNGEILFEYNQTHFKVMINFYNIPLQEKKGSGENGK